MTTGTTILRSRKAWAVLILALATATGIFAMMFSSRSTAVAGDQTGTPFHLAVLETGNPPSSKEVPFLQRDFLVESGHVLSSARLLSTNAAGSHVIAIMRNWDGREQVCVIATDAKQPLAGGGACGLASDFNKYGMFVTQTRGKPETDEVIGLLPDGVNAIIVRSPHGDRVMRVERNTVRFEHQGATSATLDGPSGRVDSPIAAGLDE